MKNTNSNFFCTLLINLGFNIMYSVPAWVLLALHFWLGWPIWLFWLALGLWIGGVVLWMLIIKWAAKCGDEPAPYQENKNPYSSKAYKPYKKESDQNNSDK